MDEAVSENHPLFDAAVVEGEVGDEEFAVAAGDTVCIPPGTWHCIEASAEGELRFLCCCAPAYQHDDTELA